MRALARPLSRRLLLQATAALGGAALTGCARLAVGSAQGLAGGPSIGHVVVVGGGFGGCTAAHYLKRWGGSVEVTLVEREAAFVSCPVSNLVVAGLRPLADITHGYDGLAALGVRIVRGEAETIDVAARTLRLADGSVLRWDRLVLSPGVDFVPGSIEGLDSPAAQQRFLHAWKAGPQTEALRRQVQDMPDGGVFALAIPPTPFRCPPGPYERACLVASVLQRTKPRAKLLLLDANPEIQSKKALFERAFKDHYAGVLEYRPNTLLRGVDATRGVGLFEFEDIRADVLNVVPPQRAADIARRAGLVNINDRWVGVDWLTMEATAARGVHVLGDATFPAALMPKSGHMANQQGKVAAAAIIQLLKGEAVDPAPVLTNTCYSHVTPSEAMHVASVHQYHAAEKTFKTVPGAGGLSREANVAEGRLARAWADNIWADTLALR